MQRVNFSYLDAAALKRLGRFYNVPEAEAQYGCSLDELAYAVACAFTREVMLFAEIPCVYVYFSTLSGMVSGL